MPRHTHHTAPRPVRQAAPLPVDLWTSEVVPRLPPALADQARALHALQRKRAFASASDLLRGLLGSVLVATSLASLASWAVLIDLADLSVNGWRKRLRAANAWLLWILSELLAGPTPSASAGLPGRVLVIDATALRLPGARGTAWRMHTAYDFAAGRLAQVAVTDQHGAESLAYYALRPGDLVLADRGYGYRAQLAQVHAAAAHLIVRIYAPSCPLETADGQVLDVLDWLHSGPRRQRSLTGWCRYRQQRIAVRVIAVPLSAAATRRAQRHAQRKGQKRQRRVRPETLRAAQWLVLLTTLEESRWSDAHVLQLYRARWQIELVFKRMKQVLQLGRLRTSDPVLVEATIRLWLIAWALQEAESVQIRQLLGRAHALLAQDPAAPAAAAVVVSSWGVTQLGIALLRHQVRGQWSQARLYRCLPRLRRFLCPSPRKRRHGETELRAWLAQHWTAAHEQPQWEGR